MPSILFSILMVHMQKYILKPNEIVKSLRRSRRRSYSRSRQARSGKCREGSARPYPEMSFWVEWRPFHLFGNLLTQAYIVHAPRLDVSCWSSLIPGTILYLLPTMLTHDSVVHAGQSILTFCHQEHRTWKKLPPGNLLHLLSAVGVLPGSVPTLNFLVSFACLFQSYGGAAR
jgi:hypothetical protein